MSFTWPDPISLVADIVTLIGVPTLAFSTWSLYQQLKEERTRKVVGEDSLDFFDVDTKCAVNLVPLKNVTSIPRRGERVVLPGQTRETKSYGSGRYEVIGVDFYYRQAPETDRPSPAATLAIQVNVKKSASWSN